MVHYDALRDLCTDLPADDEPFMALQECLLAVADSDPLDDAGITLPASDFPASLQALMQTISVRTAHGVHPRARILGQLEARLVDADLVILAGLNEGTWPPDPGHDPWMSRPMRARFGLPAAERALTLAAHDFVQGLCAPHVVLTRAQRVAGSPTLPARWLLRLQTVLQAAGLPPTLPEPDALAWLRQLENPAPIPPAQRPAACPPLAARPRTLSVSAVQQWLRDPYGLYARAILKLRALKPLEQPIDAALQGDMLHAILKDFVQAYPDSLPDNAYSVLCDTAQALVAHHYHEQEHWKFWLRRFDQIAKDFIEYETKRRENYMPLLLEASGKAEMNPDPALSTITSSPPFILHARADRIDARRTSATPENAAPFMIMDYKSGGGYSSAALTDGREPQLALEGLIAQRGGFGPALIGTNPNLTILSFAAATVNEITAKPDAVANAEVGLLDLIQRFDDPATPYLCLPDPARAPRFNDYAHLSRTAEWAQHGDENDDTATEGWDS